MAKQTLPYPPGFVEPITGRVAVLVREYAASDLNGDAPAYWYSAQSEEWGLDPWRVVEGVDPHVHGGSFDVCFASGGTRTVGPLMTFFVSAAHAQQLAVSRAASQMGRYGMRAIEVQQGPDDLKRLAELYADDAKKE